MKKDKLTLDDIKRMKELLHIETGEKKPMYIVSANRECFKCKQRKCGLFDISDGAPVCEDCQ